MRVPKSLLFLVFVTASTSAYADQSLCTKITRNNAEGCVYGTIDPNEKKWGRDYRACLKGALERANLKAGVDFTISIPDKFSNNGTPIFCKVE